jgi:hypothetical protein
MCRLEQSTDLFPVRGFIDAGGSPTVMANILCRCIARVLDKGMLIREGGFEPEVRAICFLAECGKFFLPSAPHRMAEIDRFDNAGKLEYGLSNSR